MAAMLIPILCIDGCTSVLGLNHDYTVGQNPGGGSSGDVHVYYGTQGSVSMRTWSHTSKLWSTAAAVGKFTGQVVPWIVPADGASSEVVALSSWSGSTAASGSFHLLEAPSFHAAFAASALPGSKHRLFDVAYEHVSGDGLVVFANGTSDPLFATHASGSKTWSSPAQVFAQAPAGPAISWIRLAANPTSDEITLVYMDASNALFGVTWNGKTWMASAPTALDINLNGADFAPFVAAYASSSGNLLVAWSRPGQCNGPSNPLYYSTKPSNSNAFSNPATTPPTIAAPGPMAAASQPGTDRIAIAMLEHCQSGDGGFEDFSAATWNGSQFVATTDLDPGIGVNYATRVGSAPVGVAWVGTDALAVYEDANTLMFTTWSPLSGWAAPMQASIGVASVITGFQLLPLSSSNVMLLMEDGTQSLLWAKKYDGATFTNMNEGSAIASEIYAAGGRPFGAVVVR